MKQAKEKAPQAAATAQSAKDKVQYQITADPKGDKEKYQTHAISLGESLNAFANRALAEAMERDKQKNQ